MTPRRGAISGEQIHALRDQGLDGCAISTHYMDEAERCDRIVYILNGKLVAGGTVADVIANSGLMTYVIEGAQAHAIWLGDLQGQARRGLRRQASSARRCMSVGATASCWIAASRPIGTVAGLSVREEPPNLEDVFIQLQEQA